MPRSSAILAAVAVVIGLTINVSSVQAQQAAGVCSVQTDSRGTLTSARNLFFSRCAQLALRDCDPVAGGGWQCSSAIIGSHGPANPAISGVAVPAASPTVVSVTNASAGSTTGAGSGSAGTCYAGAATLLGAKNAFASNCAGFSRQDCDPLAGQWICSSANISAVTQVSGGVPVPISQPGTVSTTSSSADMSSSASAASIDTQTAPAPPPASSPATTGRLGSNDLLVLHYDNCPDRDDGQAIPAGKSVVETLGIDAVMVANGTCGNSIRDRFNPGSFAVVQASWGSNYLNVADQRDSATLAATNRWATTLANGGQVWVAEGGQSDFTADVVRRIAARYPNMDLKRIHIIQHSAGATAYNEMFTSSSNLTYLKNRTSYQPIANGNVGGNGSADLNSQSAYFVATARAGRFSTEWNAGFAYLPPDCAVRTERCKLDFSDTVELLYIVGDTRTKTVDDFADNYLE